MTTITTATLNLNNLNIYSQDFNSYGIFIKPDGKKIYMVGLQNDTIWEYDLKIAWNISSAILIRSLSVAAKDTSPRSIFFNTDGTKMYTSGYTGLSIDEYDLSIPYNVATAVYLQELNVSAKFAYPMGIFFKSTGLKMYIIGVRTGGNDYVSEYDLSTAWNVTTGVFLQDYDIDAELITADGIWFKDDGTKMYAIGGVYNKVVEYNLGTAWNISTAIKLQDLDLNALIPTETEFKKAIFNPDGTKMYSVGQITDSIYEYDLATAWNISTASLKNEKGVLIFT